MKLIIPVLLAILVIAPVVQAADATLEWQYAKEDEAKINGFRILYTDVNLGSKYTHTIADPTARSVENITSTLHLIPSHQYKFTCRAYAGEGESPDSNEVTWDVPAFVPPADSHPVTITINAPAKITIQTP